MSITFNLPVGQLNGSGVFVPDTSLNGTINLRLSPYTSAAYTGTHIADGVYTFASVASGDYKVFNSGAELTSFGIIRVGESQAVLLTGNQTIGGTKTFSTQVVLSAGVQTDTVSEKTATAGVTIDGVLIKDSLDGSNIVSKDGTQTISGQKTMSNLLVPAPSAGTSVMDRANSDGRYIRREPGANVIVYSDVNFSTIPKILAQPTHVLHATNRIFVENYVTALLSGLNPSAYQQSGNIIRMIPSGVQENNKVYRTLSGSLSNAESFATASRNMLIKIQGNGTGSTDANYNLLPVGTAEPYIHIIGERPGIIVRVAEDLYTGTSGQNIYSNLIFDNEAEDANTDFTNKIFYNCKFSNTFGSGTPSYDFVGCVFIGCSITTGYTFDNTCKGELLDLVNNRQIILATDKLMDIPNDINSGNAPGGSGWTPSSELYYGTNGALMGEPAGWIPFKMNGVNYKIPYYIN